jgi:hypothetical protein
MPKIVDLIGQRFGNRVVIGPAPQVGDRKMWAVRCDCGHESNALPQNLRKTTSCMWCAHKGERPYRRKRPFEGQYNIFKNRARYKVDITYDQYAELAKQNECHYCGSPVRWSEYRRKNRSGGSGSNLDRKDYKGDYTMDNVTVCCGRCNYAKGTHFSYDEWKKIGNLIRSWNTVSDQPITPQSGRALALLQKEIEGGR